jgi:hypothetical protein
MVVFFCFLAFIYHERKMILSRKNLIINLNKKMEGNFEAVQAKPEGLDVGILKDSEVADKLAELNKDIPDGGKKWRLPIYNELIDLKKEGVIQGTMDEEAEDVYQHALSVEDNRPTYYKKGGVPTIFVR